MKTKETYSNHHEAIMKGKINALKFILEMMQKYPTPSDEKKIIETNAKIEVLEEIIKDAKYI